MFINEITSILLVITIESSANYYDEYEEAKKAALDTFYIFHDMFISCVSTPMPDQHFLMDDLKSFVNYPSKTTVGFAPRFTSNRKFFANMIGTPAFKDMIAKDEEELRIEMIKKLKYCQEVIMDEKVLKEFYDREVDQTKI